MARKRDVRAQRKDKRRPWSQQQEREEDPLQAAFQQLERERAQRALEDRRMLT